MKQAHIHEIKAVGVFALGTILFLSLVSFVPADLPWYTSHPNYPARNLLSLIGAYSAGGLFFVFGYGAYALVFFFLFWGWNKLISSEVKLSALKWLSLFALICVVSGFFGLFGEVESSVRFQRGGMVGFLISDVMAKYFGSGSYLVLFILGILFAMLAGEFLISPLILKCADGAKAFGAFLKENISGPGQAFPSLKSAFGPLSNISLAQKVNKSLGKTRKNEPGEEGNKTPGGFSGLNRSPEIKSAKPQIRLTPSSQPGKKESREEFVKDEIKLVGKYRLPPLDLLDEPPVISTSQIQSDLMDGARLLEETLANFGVGARVADIERGPAITRYELEPAPGVKVQKFTTLTNDIALAMRAETVRIVAPIPGKNRVGIEVPNAAYAAVYLKDVLRGNLHRGKESKLTLFLGKDIGGESIIADLAEMPHLLIAGTTGSGKTVCVNTIIMSMLFNVTPDEVKFVLVDPKMVELAHYSDIPHLLCPPITDVRKVSPALHWVVAEMETRYRKLSSAGVRNIKSYNAEGLRLPYIVVIIDELADLMQVSAKTVESSITRLAQLSRAVGIHLILATQRPSVDVITGVIKANFPARASFKVASKVDSRTVLDMNGAESLLGRGDMLFIKPGDAKPTRGQCSFVKDDEINRVIQFIKDQQEPEYDESIVQHQKEGIPGGSSEKDEFYDEALRLVIETNQASVSILQRRLRLGYTRAARLIDMMEQAGVVGPYCGSKPREILIDREKWLLENMNEGANGGEG